MKKIKVRLCKISEEEHRKSRRVYAHTMHRDGIICTCKDLYDLPDEHFWGILIHEIGHILDGGFGGEKGANNIVQDEFGIHIHYKKHTLFGDNLEYIEWNHSSINIINKLILPIIC